MHQPIFSLLFLILKPYVCSNNNNKNLFLIRRKLTSEYDQMRLYVDWTGEHYDKIICVIPIPWTKSSLKSTVERFWWRDFFAGAKLSHADLVSGASHIGKVFCHTLVPCESWIKLSGAEGFWVERGGDGDARFYPLKVYFLGGGGDGSV